MVGAVVVDQIWWISCEQDRLLVVHDADDVIRLGAVAAQQAMIAQQPQIARPRHRVHRRLGNDVFAGEAIALVERRQQPIELLLVETGEVEIEAGGVQRVQFRRQELLIPGTREHQLVIGDAVRPHLLGAEMRQPNDRDFGEPQVPRRQQPAMAGDHLAVLGHQQRHGPAVAGDRGGDLRHLVVRVQPRIALVRLQARDRPRARSARAGNGARSSPIVSQKGS